MEGNARSITIISISIICMVSLMILPQFVYAHKPLPSHSNDNFADATIIPDPGVSWAIYKELDRSDVQFYRFDGQKGERLFVQMTIPDMTQYRSFAPTVVLIGDGLNETPLTNAKNSEIDVLPAAETEIEGASSAGNVAVIVEYDSSAPPEKFFEPFTQTSYLIRQELTIDRLPSTGSYMLAVYDKKESGKYVLAVGEREEFGPVDFITTLPAAWFETKLFFEDFISIAISLAGIVVTISLLTVIVLRKRIKRKLQRHQDL
jgi:hypothetical protein